MDHLSSIFASKQPPENTIKRIEALEDLTQQLLDRLDGHDKLFGDLGDKSTLEALLHRVQSLEQGAEKTDQRVTGTEEDIEALKRMLESLGNMDSGNGG